MTAIPTVPFKKNRKVHYGFYSGKHGLHPVIRMSGSYLKQFGFLIGDTIEITMKKNRIVIKKIQPRSVERKK